MKSYSSAEEAAAPLGVSRSSLYAYVSRGRTRAESDSRNTRASRYLTADVERLRDRTQALAPCPGLIAEIKIDGPRFGVPYIA